MNDSEDKGPQSPAPEPFGPGSPGYGPGGEQPAPEAPAGPQSPTPSGYPPAPPPPGPETPPGGWDQPAVPGPAPAPQRGALAGWGSRAGAALIDGLILGVPAAILFLVIVGSAIGLSGDNDDVAVGAAIGAFLLWFVLVALVALAYAPVLMMRQGEHNGQSWGKQVLGIRVGRDNGQPFDFWSAALREIVLKTLALGVASFFIPVIPYLLDYLWPLWDDQNRALHDMAASTHVYRA